MKYFIKYLLFYVAEQALQNQQLVSNLPDFLRPTLLALVLVLCSARELSQVETNFSLKLYFPEYKAILEGSLAILSIAAMVAKIAMIALMVFK